MDREARERASKAAGGTRAEADAVLQGTLERVTYHDAGSLYSVLRIAPEKGYEPPEQGVMFRPERVSAVGRGDEPAVGSRLRLAGRWSAHKTHGLQFEFDSLEVLPPVDRGGLVKYLSSSRFHGVGEKLAQRIVDELGERALEVILERPAELARVRGLKPAVRDALIATAQAEAGTHKANVFLRGLGLGPWQASTILRKLGPQAEARIRDDPYVIGSGIAGIGFATADRLALGLGFAHDDPRRARAGLVHALELAGDEGHTLLARARLVEETARLFSDGVPPQALEAALDELAARGAVRIERPADAPADDPRQDRVYLPSLAHCENELARNLRHLLAAPEVRALATEAQLLRAEETAGIELHPLQRTAVLGLLATPVGLLTGGPGVGKTTIVRLVVALARAAHARVKLASPTGRAAKRLSEATGESAETVHRLLGYDPGSEGFLHDATNPLEADLVVVDEISMLDVVLAHHLVKALRAPTRVLFVGDPNQLPSVGPGNVLHDLIESGVVPVHRLTEIYRQAHGSLIVTNAHRILHGEPPVLPERGDVGSDFYFFQAEDPPRCAERLVEVVTRRIPERFGLRWTEAVQVIAPMYRGECGVDALNERLREEQGRGGRRGGEVVQGNRSWRAGDRVIHTRNDYEKEVFNGDMGTVDRVLDESTLVVRFPEREVVYAGSELSDLQPAFAITVHRAQGAEFPAVVFPLVTQHWMMLQRSLFYTAITRARRLVVLVGSPRALQMAIENADERRRESALAEKLRRALA